MDIQLIPAKALLDEILESDDSQLTRIIKGRLERSNIDFEEISNLQVKLSNLIEGLADGSSLANGETLTQEFAAFTSWMMVDLATSRSSEIFNISLKSRTLNLASRYEHPQPLRPLEIQGWVVGLPGNGSKPSCALHLPTKALGLDQNLSLAYGGLVELFEFLDAATKFLDNARDLEMLVTSVSVRLIGLTEALVKYQGAVEKAGFEDALRRQISRVRHGMREQDQERWKQSATDLVLQRNAIAHIWNRDQGGISFSAAVEMLDFDQAAELGTLASHFICAELSSLLLETRESTVNQWLNQTNRVLDRALDNLF